MRTFLFGIALLLGVLTANAQYKVDNMDGKCYMAAACITEGMDDNTLFANIVLWAQNAADVPGLDFFSKLDYGMRHMELETRVKVKNVTYTGMLKVDVYGGIIKFRVDDIVQQTTIIMSPKLTPLEKLQPYKKPAHKVAIEEFEAEESILISNMLDFAKTNALPKITHWTEIKDGKIVKGMNEVECQLAVGRPRIVIDGDEKQWQINSSMYVFFKNGVVSSIVR